MSNCGVKQAVTALSNSWSGQASALKGWCEWAFWQAVTTLVT